MSKSTQCVKPPASGASGSCMISANDLVPAGASFHDSAGDGFCMPASHVNFDGILPLFSKAGLERANAAAMTISIMHCSWAGIYPTAHSTIRFACGRILGAATTFDDKRKTVYTGRGR